MDNDFTKQDLESIPSEYGEIYEPNEVNGKIESPFYNYINKQTYSGTYINELET